MASSDSDTFHWHYTDFDDNTFQIRGRTLFFVVLLFCAVIFVTLIYLYASWVCRTRPPSGSLIPRLTHAPPPEPRGLDLNAIGSLPIVLHRAARGNQQSEVECPICLGIFQDGEKVKVLPSCQHCYHSECVDSWLKTQSSCPLCRASLRVDSPV